MIAHLKSKKTIPATRLTDIKILQLPATWESAITKAVYQERMKWEPWIETADSYSELRKSLALRKFKYVPACATPKILFPNAKELENKELQSPKKTMIRRHH
jgi:hypothetical protein